MPFVRLANVSAIVPNLSTVQVEALAQRALDRRLSRLDTSIYRGIKDPTKKPGRPC